MPEAREAGGRPKGLGKGVAEGDADVFGGVMVVDWERRKGGEYTDKKGYRGLVWWEYSLCRSPLQLSARLQPACFDRACSMWSRKPMPVLMLMTWDLLAWVA